MTTHVAKKPVRGPAAMTVDIRGKLSANPDMISTVMHRQFEAAKRLHEALASVKHKKSAKHA